MEPITKRTKNSLLQELVKNHTAIFSGDGRMSITDFLSLTWDLRLMPSTDGRYPDALGDVYQHMINNDDWTYEFLFFDRLKVLDTTPEQFIKLLESLVSPLLWRTEDEINKYAFLINSFIEKDGYLLTAVELNELGQPLYKIKNKDDAITPTDFKRNRIPFFVEKNPLGNSKLLGSHKTPMVFPSFVLVYNPEWNDFSKKTSFHLFYYDENGHSSNIGKLKIIYEIADAIEDMKDSIIELLPETFTDLESKFCSLGEKESYYYGIKSIGLKQIESIFYALRDVAFFPEIREAFELNPLFKNSLIRYEDQERLSRIARYLIFGFDLSNLFSFKYFFQPPYSESTLNVNFNFTGTGEISNRIIALIGKNGVGKTQLITSIPLKIAKNEAQFFSPKTPLFSKVIAVSYSVFDSFKVPKKTSTFNYIYCGLKNEDSEVNSARSQTLRFHTTWKKIRSLERIERWGKILYQFIDPAIVDEMIVVRNLDTINGKKEYDITLEGVNSARSKLSSGQSIILSIISEVVANIMYDSLLLYDEPETHLHPNAITELMNTIYQLVNEFQSYCIIATHSPLVIRELFSRNVYVMGRDNNIPYIKQIGIECFGESLTTITEEVFGNKDAPKQYKAIVQKLVNGGKSFDEIIELLQSEGAPLSLNARIYIKSLLNEKA